MKQGQNDEVTLAPGEFVRVGNDGPISTAGQLEEVHSCQRCRGERLMFLHSPDFGGFSYGMVGGELRSANELPDNLQQFRSYSDLEIVFCLDCGQLQGAWPLADVPKPEERTRKPKQPQSYADFAALAKDDSQPKPEVAQPIGNAILDELAKTGHRLRTSDLAARFKMDRTEVYPVLLAMMAWGYVSRNPIGWTITATGLGKLDGDQKPAATDADDPLDLRLLRALGRPAVVRPASASWLAVDLNAPANAVVRTLTTMQQGGTVKCAPGGWVITDFGRKVLSGDVSFDGDNVPVTEISAALGAEIVAKGLAKYVDGPTSEKELKLTSKGETVLRQEAERAEKALELQKKLPPGAYLADPNDTLCDIYMVPEVPAWDLEKYNAAVPPEKRIELDDTQLELLQRVEAGEYAGHIATSEGWDIENVFDALSGVEALFNRVSDFIYLTPLGKAVLRCLKSTSGEVREKQPEHPYCVPSQLPGTYGKGTKTIRPGSVDWRFSEYEKTLLPYERFGIDRQLIRGLNRMGISLLTAAEVEKTFDHSEESKDNLVRTLLRAKLIVDNNGRYFVSELGHALAREKMDQGGTLVAPPAEKASDLDANELKILRLFKEGTWLLKGLANRTQMGMDLVGKILMELESKGLVEQDGDGCLRTGWQITKEGEAVLVASSAKKTKPHKKTKPAAKRLDLKPAEWQVLRALAHAAWSLPGIARHLGIGVDLAEQLLTQMESKGLAKSSGARKSIWEGTEAGEAALVADEPEKLKNIALGRRHLAVLGALSDGNYWTVKGVAKKMGAEESFVLPLLAFLEIKGLVRESKRHDWRLTNAGKVALTSEPKPGPEPKSPSKTEPKPEPGKVALPPELVKRVHAGLCSMGEKMLNPVGISHAFNVRMKSVDWLIDAVLLPYNYVEEREGGYVVTEYGKIARGEEPSKPASLADEILEASAEAEKPESTPKPKASAKPKAKAKAKPKTQAKKLPLDELKPREKAALKALYIAAKHEPFKHLKVSQIVSSSKHGQTTLRRALHDMANTPLGRRFLVRKESSPPLAADKATRFALTTMGVRAAKELIG